MKDHTTNNVNTNGVDNNYLYFTNTAFQHHMRRRYTGQPPGGRDRNQIDYILIRRQLKRVTNPREYPVTAGRIPFWSEPLPGFGSNKTHQGLGTAYPRYGLEEDGSQQCGSQPTKGFVQGTGSCS